MLSVIQRAVFIRTLSFKRKYNTNFVRYASIYKYEMPELYQKSFYLANASFHDNVNWYFFRAIEVAFDKFVERMKTIAPSFTDENTANSVLNKVNMLDPCSYLLEVNIPLLRDSGRLEMIQGFCAKHGVHYQTHLGGLRLDPNLEKPHLRALAALASYKHMCVNVPFAGAHSGIKINPLDYSAEELNRLISTFVTVLTEKNFFGPQINVFEPELNCNAEMINRIIEAYSRIKGNTGENSLACVTGKSLINGGLHNYYGAIADGIFYGVDNFIQSKSLMNQLELTKGWNGKTYIIKGLGKVGIHLVDMLAKEGAKCVGICEVDVSYYNTEGINIEEVIQYKLKHGSLLNHFPAYDAKKIMYEECDLMIIAASHKTLTCYTAPSIKAKIIIEAASGAITPTAHKILLTKNKLILPDVFINSGSSIASYVEYTQNIESSERVCARESSKNILFFQDSKLPYLENRMMAGLQFYPELKDHFNDDIVTPAIQSKINDSSKRIMEILQEYNLGLDVRTAAYISATEKIFGLLQNNRFL